MSMLAEQVEVVIGVDTHKHTHTAAVVTASTGAAIDELTVSTDPGGYDALVELADRHATPRVWAIEGTGSYGVGLASHLAGRGSGSSNSTGPPGPLDATAPSPIRSTPCVPPEKRWPVPVWPSRELEAIGPPCRCCWRPAAPRSKPPNSPTINSTP